MADGTTLDPGTGGDKIHTRDTDNAAGKFNTSFIVAADNSGTVVYASFGAGSADSGTLRVVHASGQTVAVTHPADTYVADAGSLGKGVLIQGSNDGTSRKNLAVTDDGDLHVSLQEATVTVPVSVQSGVGQITEYTEDQTADNNPTGGALILVRADTLSAVTSANGDNVAARGTNRGEMYVTERPATSGGLSTFKRISAASTNSALVKNSIGQVYGVQVSNTNASARYLKLYDEATAPTVGDDTPKKTFLIPPGNKLVSLSFPRGLAFGSGIGMALTTGVADDNTDAVAADEIVVHIDYM